MSCQLFSQCADEDYVSYVFLLREAENDSIDNIVVTLRCSSGSRIGIIAVRNATGSLKSAASKRSTIPGKAIFAFAVSRRSDSLVRCWAISIYGVSPSEINF